jgi:hypothetical protein
MREKRSALKARAGKPLICFAVYAQRKVTQITPCSPEGTHFHMQNNIMAVDKDDAWNQYLNDHPNNRGAERINIFGPGEPLKHQTTMKSSPKISPAALDKILKEKKPTAPIAIPNTKKAAKKGKGKGRGK